MPRTTLRTHESCWSVVACSQPRYDPEEYILLRMAPSYASALREPLVSDQLGEGLTINLHGSSRSCSDNADMKTSMKGRAHFQFNRVQRPWSICPRSARSTKQLTSTARSTRQIRRSLSDDSRRGARRSAREPSVRKAFDLPSLLASSHLSSISASGVQFIYMESLLH